MTDRVGKRIAEGVEAAGERAAAIGDAAGERAAAMGDAVGDRASAVGDAVGDRVSAVGDAVGDRVNAVAERVKPRLRGVSHQWAFVASLVAGAVLVVAADTPRATLAVAVYAASLSALLGTSALYHRVDWRPDVRRWVRRLDHSMIFLLIAGTVTPFALLVLDGPLARAILIAVWAAAGAGIVVELVWIEAPKWVTASVYLAVGWVGALGFPGIVARAGVGAGALIALGGALYTAGAVVYARQRPDPNPAVFGYHEIFHALVIAAAAAHFVAIAAYALPSA